MLHRNMLKSKKAISPILATLLLIVIAVAAIVVTYAWVMTYMGSTTEQAGVMLYEANVNFKSDDTIVIDIGNSGTSDTDIIKVYFGLSDTALDDQGITSTPLGAGNIVSFTIQYDWQPGETYYFRVVPTAGQQALAFPKTAPS
jgi:flagellin-like protein